MTLPVSQLLCFVRKKKTCEPVDPQIIAVAGDQVLTIERSHNIEFNKKSLEEFYLKSQRHEGGEIFGLKCDSRQ